jgi:hypothetical protein
MSYLTPHKLPVGYSLTRRRAEKGYDKENFPRFGKIPAHKSALVWLALRYAFVDKSIVVVTEGLGPQKFHGRVVILVNQDAAFVMLERDGSVLATTGPIHPSDARLRRAQFIASVLH